MKRNCASTSKRKSCFRGGDNGRKAENENFFGGKNRYNSRVYGSIIVRVPKEMAEAFKEKCAATGTAQAQVIKKAIEEFLAE